MSEKPVIVPSTTRRTEPLFDASGMLRRRAELSPLQSAENAAAQQRARAAGE